MKNNNICFILIFCFLIYSHGQVSAQAPTEKNKGPSGRVASIGEIVVTVAAICVVFWWFAPTSSSKPTPKAEVPQKDTVEQLVDLVGGLKPAGEHVKMGTRLVKASSDANTFIIVAQVDKTKIKEEVRNEMRKNTSNKLRKAAWGSGLALVGLTSAWLML